MSHVPHDSPVFNKQATGLLREDCLAIDCNGDWRLPEIFVDMKYNYRQCEKFETNLRVRSDLQKNLLFPKQYASMSERTTENSFVVLNCIKEVTVKDILFFYLKFFCSIINCFECKAEEILSTCSAFYYSVCVAHTQLVTIYIQK